MVSESKLIQVGAYDRVSMIAQSVLKGLFVKKFQTTYFIGAEKGKNMFPKM